MLRSSLRFLSTSHSKKLFLTATGGTGVSISIAQRLTANGSNRYYSATTTSASGSTRKSLLQRYEELLESDPVKTKMVTGSFLWGLGDFVAQVVPQLMSSDDEDKDEKNDSVNSSSSSSKGFNYDLVRTGRAVFFGFALHAPLSHVHYNFLESLTVRLGITGGIKIPIFKAVMEQFVYWSWISNTLYHGAMGAMQGKTFDQVYKKLEDVLWETQKAQWVFWIPVQLLNFRFVPVRHQLNVVLTTSVVWTALLSAWYPPEDDSAIESDANNTTIVPQKDEK